MSIVKTPGRYIGNVTQFAIAKSKEKGTLALKVQFTTKPNTDTGYTGGETVYWDAWLTENTKERVVDNLLETQLLETEDFAELAQGKGLSLTQDVELVVDAELYNGKSYCKVNYVNALGGRAMKNAVAADEAVVLLKGLNLNDTIKLGAKKLGMKPGASKQAEFATSDIPF